VGDTSELFIKLPGHFMRKLISSCIIALTVPCTSLLAQNITIPADSIQMLLCKNWEVDYAIMGGMKIGRMPGGKQIKLSFPNVSAKNKKCHGRKAVLQFLHWLSIPQLENFQDGAGRSIWN
jgi:hypothetical protein